MEALAFYLLKSVTWLTGFALIYLLFLRNERYFHLNRLYLLTGILASLFLPFISIHYNVTVPIVEYNSPGDISVTRIEDAGVSGLLNISFLLTILYLSGALFVAYKIFRQSKTVIMIIKKAEVTVLNSVKLIRTAEYATSFSFFSYVFVNPSVTDLETKEIVNHEIAHIRQRHWLDLVLVELLCLLQWFNPVVWIYVRFIRQNHEYLADEVALQRTSDPAIYKAALLNQIVGAPVIILANSFNYSLNKKRFYMMKNINNSPYRKMKILFILPVIAIVLFAFAKPDYKYAPGDKSPGPDQIVPELSKEVKGKVITNDGKPLEGTTIVVNGTTIGVSTDANGFFRIENVPEDGSLVVTYVGFKSLVLKPVFSGEMKIKMVQDTVKYLNRKTGTPPPPPPPPPTSPPPPPVPEIGVVIRNSDNPQAQPPLFVIDGVISDKGIGDIDPNSIQSMNVLKDEPAINKYGEKGKNGVIEITTKKEYSAGTGDKIQDVKITGYAGEQKEEKNLFVVVEELPEFPGGRDAMASWIVANIKYPVEAVSKKITGKVFVNFMVSSTGKIRNAKVTKAVHPLLDVEAIRVISSMPDWKPGSQAGKPVDVQIQVPVEFKLN